MPPTTGTNEEIIEKKDSSPAATSCVLVATIALLGAIVLQLMELGELKRQLSPKEAQALTTGRYKKAVIQQKLQAIDDRVEGILADAEVSVEDLELYGQIIDGAAGASGTLSRPDAVPRARIQRRQQVEGGNLDEDEDEDEYEDEEP